MSTKKTGVFEELRRNKISYLMGLPAIVLVILFSYIPYYYIVIAFKDYRPQSGIWASKWVGLKNFSFFFSSYGPGLQVTVNTIALNLMGLVFGTAATLIVSLLVNEIGNKLFKKITQTMYFFPYFLTWVVIGEIVYSILAYDSGTLNGFFRMLGIEPIQFYKEPDYWRWIITLAGMWKGMGYGVLVYTATISGFSYEYYEAAYIDGADRWKCMCAITLPMLKPTVLILTLFSLGRVMFGDFGMIYAVARNVGPILKEINVIDSYVYSAFRSSGRASIPVAIGLYQSLVGFILIIVSNKAVKKFNEGQALF